MVDILNKKNAFIAVSSIMILCALMLLMISVVTFGKNCAKQTFAVQTLENGSKSLIASIDGDTVTPKNCDDIDISGDSMVLWYNSVDNSIVEHYYIQTWGFLCVGIVLITAATLILVINFKRKTLIT